MYMKIFRKAEALILSFLCVFLLASCQTRQSIKVLTLPSLKTGTTVQGRADLDADRKAEIMSMEKTASGVRVKINDASVDYSLSADEEMDSSISVSFEVLKGDDDQKYALFSCSTPYCGRGVGTHCDFFLLQYKNKGIEKIWDGALADVSNTYANNILTLHFPKENIDISGDVSDAAKELESESGRFAPQSTEDLLNAPVISDGFKVEIKDSDHDGFEEIHASYQIFESRLVTYITSANLVWNVADGGVRLQSGQLTT